MTTGADCRGSLPWSARARYTPLNAEPGVERLDHASSLSRAVVCLLAGYLLLGLAHAALLPPWEGFDETAHYSYVQQLADRWEVPRFNRARMSAEVEAYARRAPLPYANTPPFTREGALTYGAFFAGPAEGVAHAGAFVHGRPEAPRRYVAGREMNWVSMHPPLYYLALFPVYLATRQLGWAAHLMSLRLASYLMAWAALVVGVWACATRAGWTGEDGEGASRWAMLGIALWPALVPSWFPEMVRLGNDSLSTLILAGGWLVTVRANGLAPSLGSALALGIVLAAGCLTKLYFLAVAVGVPRLLALARVARGGRDLPGIGRAAAGRRTTRRGGRGGLVVRRELAGLRGRARQHGDPPAAGRRRARRGARPALPGLRREGRGGIRCDAGLAGDLVPGAATHRRHRADGGHPPARGRRVRHRTPAPRAGGRVAPGVARGMGAFRVRLPRGRPDGRDRAEAARPLPALPRGRPRGRPGARAAGVVASRRVPVARRRPRELRSALQRRACPGPR